MSLFSNIPQELKKVLLKIFDYLNEEDLRRCETVCRQWRQVLLSGEPWERLFQRKIISSPQWRQVGRNFVPDEKKLQTEHYRSICMASIHELKQIYQNFRTGNYKETSEKVDSFHNSDVIIGCDYIALGNYRMERTLKFLYRSSLKLKSSINIPHGWSATTSAEIVVLWDERNIKILDSDGQLISEVPELDEDERVSVKLESCCLSGDQMAVLSQSKGQGKLSLWDVRNPTNVIRLKSRWLAMPDLSQKLEYTSIPIQMDDQFIAVSIRRRYSTSIYFFSKDTLHLNWQKTAYESCERDFAYDKGLLLFYGRKSRKSRGNLHEQLIEVYDVKSGQFLRELPMTMGYCLYVSVRFNSNFMVIANFEKTVTLKIYDIEDIKNPKSEANELFVHTFDKNICFKFLLMDETEIFLGDLRKEKCIVHRLNFGPFELFHNEMNTVTLSLPWRSVWRSKGVDEEPLEPLHHMEVYKEVLKYFHRLSTDSRAAIKTYPICDVNLENFTLGDDFIGFRRHRPEIIIYDENMEHGSQEMELKTVQINKNTYVSVTGKTVNLINSTTGNVVKEIRLSMDAINLHFNCNLLVFVSKIGEHEHLLSVWRVEDSLNLTHLLDVAIGDYDGSLQVDEQFIAVKTEIVEWKKKRFFYFISMKTFQVERVLSSRAKYLQYDNGYLFVLKKEDLVGILDVASGTFLRDIRIKPFRKYQMIFRVNSNYVVMAKIKDASKTARRNAQYAPICGVNNWIGDHGPPPDAPVTNLSKLYVYDLKCLKETEAVPSHLLLTSIGLECPVKEMLMNETRIVCLSDGKMCVVDLKPIDRLRCPEFC